MLSQLTLHGNNFLSMHLTYTNFFWKKWGIATACEICQWRNPQSIFLTCRSSWHKVSGGGEGGWAYLIMKGPLYFWRLCPSQEFLTYWQISDLFLYLLQAALLNQDFCVFEMAGLCLVLLVCNGLDMIWTHWAGPLILTRGSWKQLQKIILNNSPWAKSTRGPR